MPPERGEPAPPRPSDGAEQPGTDVAGTTDGGDPESAGADRPELRLGEGVRAAILEEAGRRYPEECCGGLLGRVDDERGVRTVVRAEAVRNERRERRERRYLVGPREVMRLEDRAEEEGLELFGFFHSHPDHPARPSEHDRRAAWPWYSYVIVSVHEGDPERIRSWRLTDDRGSFDEERVTATEGATDQP